SFVIVVSPNRAGVQLADEDIAAEPETLAEPSRDKTIGPTVAGPDEPTAQGLIEPSVDSAISPHRWLRAVRARNVDDVASPVLYDPIEPVEGTGWTSFMSRPHVPGK